MFGRLSWLYQDLTPHKRAIAYVVFTCRLLRAMFTHPKDAEAVWLIGEARGNCLLENGYHFFLYCREQHPEKKVFFVINQSSPHFSQLKSNPHVLRYGSAQHIDIYIQSTTCFYTHTYSDFVYREQFLTYRGKKKLVFLHHGVLGFKKFDKRYFANRNSMNLFIVGSTLERDILLNQVGVSADKIKVTGYARYDKMADVASPDRLQVTYMPTHRNWLRRPTGRFCETNFFRNVDNFINDPMLHELLSHKNIILKVYLHAVMERYSSHFIARSPRVKILAFDEEGPSRLICNSQLLITDYSSVSWDFLYLCKPVLFYRFDLPQYLASRGSYLPLDKPLFGDICSNASELVEAVAKSARSGFVLTDKYKAYRDAIMPVIDHKNSKRIYNVAKKLDGNSLGN